MNQILMFIQIETAKVSELRPRSETEAMQEWYDQKHCLPGMIRSQTLLVFTR